MPAFITWRLWLRKIYHQKGTELWINRSISQKVCLIAFIGHKLKTIRSKLRQISAQDSLRALPEMRWICALTIHFIATDLRQFFEVKSCRPLYRYIKRLWLSFGGKYINLHGELQHWSDLTRSVEIGTSNVAHVMCEAWRNIAALRVAFIELTIIDYLRLARAQLLIKSMPYERRSTICVARLEQGRGGWAYSEIFCRDTSPWVWIQEESKRPI